MEKYLYSHSALQPILQVDFMCNLINKGKSCFTRGVLAMAAICRVEGSKRNSFSFPQRAPSPGETQGNAPLRLAK